MQTIIYLMVPLMVAIAQGQLRSDDEPRMQQWNKGSRCKMAAVSDGEDIWQDLQGIHTRRAGDRKGNGWVFTCTMECEWQNTVEGLAPSEAKQNTRSINHSQKNDGTLSKNCSG